MRCKQCTTVLNSYYGPEHMRNHVDPDNAFDFCDNCYWACSKCDVCEPKRPISESDKITVAKILGEEHLQYGSLCINCARGTAKGDCWVVDVVNAFGKTIVHSAHKHPLKAIRKSKEAFVNGTVRRAFHNQ